MDEKRLTDALQRLRAHAYARPPHPSRQLSDRLDLGMLADPPPVNSPAQVAVVVAAPERRGRLRAVLSWVAGLGIVTKIVLGIGVAAIATTGVGAAGALPAPAQQLFDSVLPGIAPHSSETADDPTDQPGDDTPGTTPTAVPEDEDGAGDQSTEGDGAGKPADTPGNGGEGTGKPEDTPGNGGDGTGKPEGTPGNGGDGTGKPADTPGNGGDGTGKPDNTPGGNPNK